MHNHNLIFTAKTLSGLEAVLSKELKDLGASQLSVGRRAVGFRGDRELMMRANLHCRTALNILLELHAFSFKSKDDFFAQVREIDWSSYFDVEKTISIYAVANRSELFTNTMFLGQFVKDAIADHFRQKTGRRPDVDSKAPHIKINVYVHNQRCVVSLDSSGEPLFKRGYRREGGGAPLNEVLAAGLIMLSEWDLRSPLVDPMCGSGTFSIEAAMLASQTAPGIWRRHFGFMHWPDYDPAQFAQIQEQARQQQRALQTTILASDINIKALDLARQNIMEAGFLGKITVQRNDFFQFSPPASQGWVILNPPYGHRIRQTEQPEFYKSIGNTLKRHFAGYRAGIISQEFNGLRHIGLKPTIKVPVYNGPLECRFVVYDLFQGARKEYIQATKPKRPRL